MYNKPLKLTTLVAIAVLASACGGGGGGNASNPEPPVAPEPPPAGFRIAGTITASNSQTVDGDTNDPASDLRPNDSVTSAQAITNPVTLGGFVNQPGSGAPGRSQAGGDIDDYYRVEMLAGQSITMLVADFQQADADLYLYDTRGRILDFSIESGEIETLTVPQDGTYIVNAFAFEGATNYILAIGNQSGLASRGKAGYTLVPWQSVVKYRETAAPEVNGRDRVHHRMRRMGLEQRAGGPGRAQLMAMRRVIPGAQETAERAGTAVSKLQQIDDEKTRARLETLLAIKSLNRDPQIEYAEPNFLVRSMAAPNDPAYTFQWHYPLIELPAAWDTTAGAADVIVAVVDTGILSGHPDLRNQLVTGYDFVSNSGSARDGNGIDPNPEDPGDGGSAATSSFHGTHVSGTVAAAGNNGVGVAGVAYDSRVMPLRALGAGGEGTTYDVDQAIRYAAGLANDSGTVPARRASIINLSLGGAPFSQASQSLYRQVYDAGVVIVASAGNEASSRPSYPAAYDGVISVAAVDAQRLRASYSNTGSSIDIAAPGGNNGVDLNGDGYPDGILSTSASGGDFGYSFLNGTSMAAPHVAGVIALMRSVNPGLTPADIDALLRRGSISDDLGSPGRDDQYGHGLINAQRAVLAALQAGGSSPADNPFLSASASTLNFSANISTLELEFRNVGEGELTLLDVNSSEPWLDVRPATADTAGIGLYQVTVDRRGLDDGVYSAEITARSSVNSLTIRVIMSVGAGSPADVGVIYVLLYEPDSDEAVAQVSARSDGGSYVFAFDAIPPGRYQVFAGSDADNDLLICDSGEACGSWLTVDQPIALELNSDQEGIDFPVDYLVTIPNVDNSASGNKVIGTAQLARPRK